MTYTNKYNHLGISPATLFTTTEAAALVASEQRSEEAGIGAAKGLGLLLVLGVVIYFLVR